MRRKTREEFIQEVYKLVGNEYVVVGDYEGYNTKTELLHTKCGTTYEVRPNHFINRNHRCTYCSRLKKKTHEQFVSEVSKLVGNDYTVLSKYINNRVKILMKHNYCGHEWRVRAASFLNDGNRCPLCNESKGEKSIRKWLDDNNISYQSQIEFDGLVGIRGKNLSYDFYIPEINTLIEYQGEYHDGTANNQTKKQLEIQQEHDKRKLNYAKNNDIKLLEIWYWDFNNIADILNKHLMLVHV